MPTIYNYDPVTGEYLGADPARESPREPGVYLIPACATDIAPPAVGTNQAAVFIDDGWLVVPDHRRVQYYDTATREPRRVALINVLPDQSWTDQAPPSEDHAWDGMRWLLDLNRVKAKAATKIDVTAGETSLRYITCRAGQEATYLYKAEQARAHKAAAYPAELAAYPLVSTELEALKIANPAATAQTASDYILATEALWIAKAAQIEKSRRVGKEKVKTATTEAAILAARDEAITVLKAL